MVVSLELNRRHAVERLVDAPVVEPVDVVERGPLDVLHVASGTLPMDQLALVETVERLGHGIVVGNRREIQPRQRRRSRPVARSNEC